MCIRDSTMAHSDFYSPSKIESITGATMITAGANHAMVYAVGKVYTWGANDSGQLGKGTDTFSASTDGVPKEINIPTSIATVDQIIARGDYSAIISDGKAYLWGANGNYQLGNNSDTNVLSVPDTALNIEENIQAMALGYSHIVAITEKGNVYAWGNNTLGQLGLSTNANEYKTPNKVYSGASSQTNQYMINMWGVGAGYNTSFAVASNGIVYGWGQNDNGQLGIGTRADVNLANTVKLSDKNGLTITNAYVTGSTNVIYDSNNPLPYNVTITPDDTLTISNNSITMAAADNDFNLFASNDSQISIADSANIRFYSLDPSIMSVNETTGVVTLSDATKERRYGTTVIKVVETTENLVSYIKVAVRDNGKPQAETGVFASPYTDDGTRIMVKNDGTIYTWGSDNKLGQLGRTGDTTEPAQVKGNNLDTNKVVQAAVGNSFVVVLTSDGAVYSWGVNTSGQNGYGYAKSYNRTPVATAIPRGKVITQIAVGESHVIALSSDGDVYAWGNNDNGQLGIGIKIQRELTPTLLPITEKVVQIAATGKGGAALTEDGHVYAWGNGNLSAELKAEGESAGDTDHKLQNIVRLASVGNVFTVSDANGTTYAWGEGSVHGKEISSDEPVSYDEMKVLNLNVVYAQVKENDEVTRAYTMSNPLPTSLELTSNQILQIAGDSVWGSANIESSSVYDRVGYEMTTDRLTFTSSNPSAVTVDSNGVVTGMGRIDSSVITVTDKILGSSYSFTVRVAQSADTEITVPMIVSGYGHTLALRADGTVWAWGDNTYGQLGDGTYGTSNVDKFVPRQVRIGQNESNTKLLTNIKYVAAGANSSAAIDQDGLLYVWGNNDNGQLGVDGKIVVYPTLVEALKDNPATPNADETILVSAVELSESHTIIIDALTKRAYTWGKNDHNQLGYQQSILNNGKPMTSPSTENYAKEAHLVTRDKGDLNFLEVASGKNHSVGIVIPASEAETATQGTVYAWGDNTYGQLGQNTSGSSSAVLQAVKKSNGESITNAVAVAAAGNYSLALTADGIVYAWGDNTYGVMGNGTKGGIQKSAVAVAGVTGDGTLEGIYAIAASPKTAVAISKDGHVYSWGNNDNGQIGDATHFERLYPVMQSDINNAKAVSAGDGYTVVQTTSGNMYAWGKNDSGQIGNSTFDEQLVPVAVGANSKLTIRKAGIVTNTQAGSIVTSAEFAMFSMLEESDIVEMNEVYSAGDDISLQSFESVDYDTENYVPRTITLTNDASGNIQQFVLDKNAVYDEMRFYLNTDSETGNDEFKVEDIYMIPADTSLFSVDDNWIVTPTQKAIDSKYAVTTLIVQDRTRNIAQTFELEFRATKRDDEEFGKDILAAPMVASNSFNSIALMSDGTVWTWGDNTYGQLGNNSVTPSSMPVQVRNPISDGYLDGIVKVAQGKYHSVALTLDGKVYTWGHGADGQLGTGNTSDSLIPVAVVTGASTSETEDAQYLTDIVDITAGDDFTAALDNKGRVWMFGNNASGLLGISKTDDIQKYPQRVLAGKSKSTTMYLENIVSIAAGAHHMLALDKNGSVWAWGDNSRGQLGEGTYEDVLEADGTKTSATTRTVPVAVDIQDVEKIYAGYNNSAAIKTDGTPWAWGDNSYSQVGNNSTADVVAVPAQVMYEYDKENHVGVLLTDIRQISVGKEHMNALTRSEKNVVTWGKNLNTITSASGIQTNKMAVELLDDLDNNSVVTDTIMIASGDNTTAILRSNGDVYSIGNNANGQLGDGTAVDKDIPVLVGIGRSADTVMMNSGAIIRRDANGDYTDITKQYTDDDPMPYAVSYTHLTLPTKLEV